MKYTQDQIDYLVKNYSTEDRDIILENIAGHNWGSIKSVAYKLGLRRKSVRHNKLRRLLDNNHVNYYWWGFIMADGHISKSNTLSVYLGIKDKHHLEKLGAYLNAPIRTYGTMCHLDLRSVRDGAKLKEKLQISNRKTYNPPSNLDFLSADPDALLCFLIGFIDGDGSIGFRPTGFQYIKIVVHESWFDLFMKIKHALFQKHELEVNVSYNKRKNTCCYLCSSYQFEFLKSIIRKYKLPALERKWRI